MSIDFAPERWDRLRLDYDKWWSYTLDRPLVSCSLYNRDPGRPCPSAPVLSQATCADLSIPVEGLVDRLDWELSHVTYLGDSFPRFNMDVFGPGVAAAFAGAILDNSTGRVWFHPPRPDIPIEDIHIEYQDGNVWLDRVKEFCAAAMDRWQGQVLVAMPDLGGNLDIVQSFVTAERLLLELYDNPGEVLRLLWEEHDLWHRVYQEINEVLQPVNPGYSDWLGVYSDRPSYVLQCDFSYMIGPDSFRKFVAPELAATCKRIDHTMYHLDGPGELPHLDQLLAIAELGGIQWVPGGANPDVQEWPEVNGKIGASGKNLFTWGTLERFNILARQFGRRNGIYYALAYSWDGSEPVDNVRRKIALLGADTV
ncbi:MAG: hypothetical protein P4L33_13555 [Capsulimonadaceae bacterium]|nr:hypothetical protein [Capsulimonadaceae bacterium]